MKRRGRTGQRETRRAQEAAPKPKWIGAKDEAVERGDEPCAGTRQEEHMRDTHHQHTYVYHAYALLARHPHTAYPLVPRVNGSLVSVSLRSTPVQPPVPFADQFALSPSPSGVSTFSPRTMLHLTSFVCSFLRSFVLLLPRAPWCGVSETSMRDSSSFLISLSHSLPLSFSPSLFPFTLPFPPPPRRDTRALLSFPRLVPSSFPIRRVSTVNRYFRSDAFRLSITVSLFFSLSLSFV